MSAPHRLSSADFRVLRPYKRIAGEFFTLSLAPHAAGLKWTCVVSKKVSPKAVARNAVKRRCRSVLQSQLKRMKEPIALVFYAKRAAAQAPIADVKKDLETLLGRAGLRGTMRGT